ncbi:MAG: carbamate kinase [Acidimicrobiia bacterium]|nr:carbamate kinase [Acidimicrobiia bacterium]
MAEETQALGAAFEVLAPAIGSVDRVLLTHGNGPQVGNLLLRSELSVEAGVLPGLPLDTCVADTAGGLGYLVGRELANALARAGTRRETVAIVTRTAVRPLVAGEDVPLKPIGHELPADRRLELEARGWTVVELPNGSVRRVVPSPEPLGVLELATIRSAFERGTVVIAGGGGGVPVCTAPDGSIVGVEAVVDKDLVSALLALELRADTLLILTDVECVFLDYGGPAERPLGEIDVASLRRFQRAGSFGEGSMNPKVEAVARFVEGGGRRGVVCALGDAALGLAGRSGTQVVAGSGS